MNNPNKKQYHSFFLVCLSVVLWVYLLCVCYSFETTETRMIFSILLLVTSAFFVLLDNPSILMVMVGTIVYGSTVLMLGIIEKLDEFIQQRKQPRHRRDYARHIKAKNKYRTE